jgi:hypothetical protein
MQKNMTPANMRHDYKMKRVPVHNAYAQQIELTLVKNVLPLHPAPAFRWRPLIMPAEYARLKDINQWLQKTEVMHYFAIRACTRSRKLTRLRYGRETGFHAAHAYAANISTMNVIDGTARPMIRSLKH